MGNYVTPCVGVWIETDIEPDGYVTDYVTPCVGVWIETKGWAALEYDSTSHPAWVCGLKRRKGTESPEIDCHTLRGCVD